MDDPLAPQTPIPYSPAMNDIAAPPVSNVPEYTMSEIPGAVKRTLEGNCGRVRVRGEIIELKRYPSGQIYFLLKDERAKIAGVVWKSAVSRLGKVPENGVEVIATGPSLPPPGACLRTGRKLALLDTARRRAQAVHRAADPANSR